MLELNSEIRPCFLNSGAATLTLQGSTGECDRNTPKPEWTLDCASYSDFRFFRIVLGPWPPSFTRF